ncbi:MAG: hypothetical protein NTY31_01295 [Candidatus Falkowbacteria bacterium]|nr:hypothetical protein [Candidatus Falkowbacteria bacterium]
MKNSKLIGAAILNSLGVTIYVFLVAQIMNNGEKIFGKMAGPFAPVAFLLLFVFSALMTGGLILGRPIILFLDGQKKEGLKLLFYTGACLLILLILAFLTMLLTR